MIDEIMDGINNHFAYALEISNFEIVADGITGNFQNDYIVGQYILIKSSVLNDSVYKVTQVESNKLTLEGTLIPESTNNNNYNIGIYALRPPKGFLTLVDTIASWETSNSSKAGISSEKIDDYSVSFAGDGSAAGNTWENAFKSKLSKYRRVFTDLDQFNININDFRSVKV